MFTKLNIKDYLSIGVVAVLLFFLSREAIRHRNDNRENEAVKAELRQQVASLVTAKTETLVKYDTIIKEIPRYYREYVPQAVDSMLVYEIIDGKLTGDWSWDDFDTLTVWERTYADSLVTGDFALPYRIRVTGDLNDISFGNYRLFTKEKVVNHIVEKQVVSVVEKSHLYFHCQFGTEAFERMESVDLSLHYANRKGWGLLMGWQRFQNTNCFKAGVSIRIL